MVSGVTQARLNTADCPALHSLQHRCIFFLDFDFNATRNEEPTTKGHVRIHKRSSFSCCSTALAAGRWPIVTSARAREVTVPGSLQVESMPTWCGVKGHVHG